MSDKTKFALNDNRHPAYKVRYAKFKLPKAISMNTSRLYRRMMAQAMYEQANRKVSINRKDFDTE